MTPRRPWTKISLPPSVTEIASFLSNEETQYLTWLTAEKFEGWGAIVELGTWLGGSSAALAEGLRRNTASGKIPGGTIYSFDRFRWDAAMDAAAQVNLTAGDDFLPLYLQGIAEYSASITVQKTDLNEFSWQGGPIEILFVDWASTWEELNRLFRAFGPSLVPGRSRIVFREFRSRAAHCLPLLVESRPDVWKQAEDTNDGTTVTFIPAMPLDGGSGNDNSYAEESFPLAAAEQLLRNRMAREEGSHRLYLLTALYRKNLLEGSVADVHKVKEAALAAGIGEGELKALEELAYQKIDARAWVAIDARDFGKALADAARWFAITGERTVQMLMFVGYTQLRMGEREKTRQSIDQMLALRPGWPDARILRAELEMAEGHYVEATAELIDILERNSPNVVPMHYALSVITQAGWCIYNSGQYADAADLARRSMTLSQMRSIELLRLLGSSLLRMGDTAAAREATEEALIQAPNDVSARLLRAEILLADAKYQEAAAETFDVLEHGNPNQTATGYALGILSQTGWRAYDAGQFDTVVSLARRCISFSKSQNQADEFLRLLGRALLQKGDTAAAGALIAEALEKTPNNPTARLLHAKLLLSEFNYKDGASEALDVIEHGNPDDMPRRFAIHVAVEAGWLAYGVDEFEAASAIARRCLLLCGDRPVVLLMLLGYSSFRLGDNAGARQLLAEALDREPNDVSAALLGAELMLAEARYAETAAKVLDLLRSVGMIEPQIEAALGLLVRAWDRLRISEERLSTLRELEGMYTQSPSFQAHLAREYFLAGDDLEAMATIERAEKLWPRHYLVIRVSRRIGAANLQLGVPGRFKI